MNKIHNYSAGPCILPKEVFQEAAESILNFNEKDFIVNLKFLIEVLTLLM